MSDQLRKFRGEARTVTVRMEDDPYPEHWAWHPLARRFLWPVWERLGLFWFYTMDGKFYLGRFR